MMELTLQAGFGALIVAVLLGLWRLLKGPTVMDRILAFDIVATCAMGMVILLSIQWKSSDYLELVLAFSLLGFFTTVAFVYHLQRTQEPAGRPTPKPQTGDPPAGQPTRTHD